MDEKFEDKLRRDIYDGNGKDSLMTRMRLTEDRVDGLKETMERMDKKLSRIGIMVAGALLAFVAEMIVKGIWH